MITRGKENSIAMLDIVVGQGKLARLILKGEMTMYGGTAKTYVDWERASEPFKDGKSYYIKVKKPNSELIKIVRWYTDKAHAELNEKNAFSAPLYSLFGFENEQDTIAVVYEADIDEDEAENLKLNGWSNRAFYGGCWIAKKGRTTYCSKKTPVHIVDWVSFKAEGQRISAENNIVSKSESCWYK